ncbi:MAG: D-aminoacylase [Pyrinomonadaceae bacterium]
MTLPGNLDRFVLLFTLAISLSLSIRAQERPVLIKNATIIDGTGRRAFDGDVLVKKGRIARIGNIKISKNYDVVDATGKVLAPGFIDIHNHSSFGLLSEGTAANQVSQGITTVVIGPDGGSPFPLPDYFDSIDGSVAVNVAAFIGHATVRQLVLKTDYMRKATPQEVMQMAALVRRSMKDGAFGLSTGLEYDVGFSASTDEIIELAKAAAKFDGIYMTHMRDEEEGMLDALREAVRIGRQARLPVQISHIKMGNRNVWGKSPDAIALIEAERLKGLDITADAYPYTAWASTITVLVPSRRHTDRDEIAKGLRNVGGADKVLVTSCDAHRDYEGRTLEDIAASKNTSPVDVYIEIVKNGGAGVVCNSMNETDVRNFYTRSWVMVSSDGGIGSRHPRGTGTFTRVLSRFVRENGWLEIEEAVRKMSSMPAARLQITDRGLIRKRMKADLVLFDKEKVIDNATFSHPQQLSSGVDLVLVNGIIVWEKGKATGKLPGQILRKR